MSTITPTLPAEHAGRTFATVDELERGLRGRALHRRARSGDDALPHPQARASRSCWKARPASARPRSPRSSPTILDTPLIRLQCYEGLDAASAIYEWDYPRQMLYLRTLEATGGVDREQARHDLFSEEFLLKRPLLQAIDAAHEQVARPADRRGRPRRSGAGSVPAGAALRLPGDRARARHDPRRARADRDPDLEPHPRDPRRAQAPLPLLLDRLPELREGVPHPRGQGAGGAGEAGPPDLRLHPGAARGRSLQAAGHGRDARLGAAPCWPSARSSSTSRPSTTPSASS